MEGRNHRAAARGGGEGVAREFVGVKTIAVHL